MCVGTRRGGTVSFRLGAHFLMGNHSMTGGDLYFCVDQNGNFKKDREGVIWAFQTSPICDAFCTSMNTSSARTKNKNKASMSAFVPHKASAHDLDRCESEMGYKVVDRHQNIIRRSAKATEKIIAGRVLPTTTLVTVAHETVVMKFDKPANRIGIKCSATSLEELWHDIAVCLMRAMKAEPVEQEWRIKRSLPVIFNIGASIKGYKSDGVQKQTMYVGGDLDIPEGEGISPEQADAMDHEETA